MRLPRLQHFGSSKAEMSVLNKNQMIDQIDVNGSQEKRGFVRRVNVGIARPGGPGRMIVGHDDSGNSAAQQGSPASRRDNAAPQSLAIDTFQPDKAVKSNPATSNVSRSLSNSGRSSWCATASSEGNGTNADSAEGSGISPTGSNRVIAVAMRLTHAIPNARLPRIGGFVTSRLVGPLSARRAKPSTKRQSREPSLA
jgi:hypothetical protein